MKRITCFLPAALLLLCALNASACTCFAVYSPAPLYGMNWDYPDAEAYLRLNHPEGYYKVFSFGFETEYGMATNGSMNDQGFIALIQDLHPREEPTAALDDASVQDMHDYAGSAPYLFARAHQVRDMLDGGMHVANRYHTLHSLFADAQGDAFVLEEYNKENIVTNIKDGMLVMTNFPNHLIGQFDQAKSEYELQSSYGFVGVDRYNIAHEIIAARRDDFNVSIGFDTLKSAAQYGLYRTRFSGVYDPVNKDVYIALERDYDHIWKISLTKETVETYDGFGAEKLVFSIAELYEGDLGIPFERLLAYAKD